MQRRTMRAVALALGLSLTITGSVLLWQASRESTAKWQTLDRNLSTAARGSAVLLAEHFERGVAADLQLAAQPAFKRFYTAPGTVDQKIARDIPVLREIEHSLHSIETIFPGAVSEACFISLTDGQEIARIVSGEAAATADLSPDETKSPFFAPTVPQDPGVPYQSQPYESPDTGLWVVATSTLVSVKGQPRAMVHFETSLESLRESAVVSESGEQIRVVDATNGSVVMDGDAEQVKGAGLAVSTTQRSMACPKRTLRNRSSRWVTSELPTRNCRLGEPSQSLTGTTGSLPLRPRPLPSVS